MKSLLKACLHEAVPSVLSTESDLSPRGQFSLSVFLDFWHLHATVCRWCGRVVKRGQQGIVYTHKHRTMTVGCGGSLAHVMAAIRCPVRSLSVSKSLLTSSSRSRFSGWQVYRTTTELYLVEQILLWRKPCHLRRSFMCAPVGLGQTLAPMYYG